MPLPPPPLFHSLLRPCVLQILRAQGYFTARPSVVDTLTDMAARYLTALCEATAQHTAHNSTTDSGFAPTIADVRMALEDCGTLLPPAAFEGPLWEGDDTRSVDEFVEWASGPRNREIRRVALDGDDENTDYLSVLKKKHSKTGEDSKYNGTVLGRGNEHGEVIVEGGEFPSILSWQERRIDERQQPLKVVTESVEEVEGENENEDEDEEGAQARSPSSGLSSLGDREMEAMEVEFAVTAPVKE